MDTRTWQLKEQEINLAIKNNGGLNSMYLSPPDENDLYPIRLMFSNGEWRDETIPFGIVRRLATGRRPRGLNALEDTIEALPDCLRTFEDVRIQARFSS